MIMLRNLKLAAHAALFTFFSSNLVAGDIVPISPGSADATAIITDTCPTFSWSQVVGAEGYELAVFKQTADTPESYEHAASIADPVIVETIPAQAFSWTPSSELCLAHGISFIWYVRELVDPGPGAWSTGNLFTVDEAITSSVAGSSIAPAIATLMAEVQALQQTVTMQQKEIANLKTGSAASTMDPNTTAMPGDTTKRMVAGRAAAKSKSVAGEAASTTSVSMADGNICFDGDCRSSWSAGTYLYWVPKTGQTQCWNEDRVIIGCTGTGQDGEYQMGGNTVAPADHDDWHPFLLSDNPNRFNDNHDGTVLDKVTGLIWLKNANCSTFNAYLQPPTNKRDWDWALISARTLGNGYCGLTDGSLAGDWRLPNHNELLSLTDPTHTNPALPSGHPFSGVQMSYYWSSTTYASYTGSAWFVNLSSGSAVQGYKTNSSHVWPVRSGQ